MVGEANAYHSYGQEKVCDFIVFRCGIFEIPPSRNNWCRRARTRIYWCEKTHAARCLYQSCWFARFVSYGQKRVEGCTSRRGEKSSKIRLWKRMCIIHLWVHVDDLSVRVPPGASKVLIAQNELNLPSILVTFRTQKELTSISFPFELCVRR